MMLDVHGLDANEITPAITTFSVQAWPVDCRRGGHPSSSEYCDVLHESCKIPG